MYLTLAEETERTRHKLSTFCSPSVPQYSDWHFPDQQNCKWMWSRDLFAIPTLNIKRLFKSWSYTTACIRPFFIRLAFCARFQGYFTEGRAGQNSEICGLRTWKPLSGGQLKSGDESSCCSIKAEFFVPSSFPENTNRGKKEPCRYKNKRAMAL